MTSQYYASIALTVKNEHDKIREWIAYHHDIIKFDHFYITDNNSSPRISTIIQDYIDLGIVTYRIDNRQIKDNQSPVCNDTLRLHRNETRWMAFIDTDEFIVLKKHNNIQEFLKCYEEFGAVSVCWYLFGSNGRVKRQMSGYAPYTKRLSNSCHYKTIVQPTRIIEMGIHNVVSHAPGYHTVDEQKHQVSGPFTLYQNTELIQLNHYVVRSFEEYLDKMQRSSKQMSFFERINDSVTVDDYSFPERLITLGGTVAVVGPDYDIPADFNWEAYIIINSNLHHITNEYQAKYHWITLGKSDNLLYRWENGNDKWKGYLDRYPDLRQNGVITQYQSVIHYLYHGKNEGRVFG